MANADTNRKEQARWQQMKRRGQLLELVLNASIWVGSYFVVRLLHVIVFKFGWTKSPGTTSWEDVIIWTVTGIFVGAIDWSDMKRKFRNPPPEEDWMAK
jgi:hypothetical protein